MHVALDIFVRGLFIAVLVTALGSPISIWLSGSRDAIQCAALAPVFGMSSGTAIATASLWFAAAGHTPWLLPVAAACAVAVSLVLLRGRVRARWSSSGRSAARAVAAILALAIVVALPAASAFVAQHSVGPVGYQIGDAEGYVAEIDGMQHQSISTAIRSANTPHAQVRNLTQLYWDGYASSVQEIDAAPLIAEIDVDLGVGATSTQSVFLVFVLVVGALGIFASLPRSTGKGSGVIRFAMSALFGGCMFLQLLFDGSEGALLGLSVVVPLVVFLADFGKHHRAPDIAATAVLVAALIAFYPLFIPAVAIGILIAYSITSMRQVMREGMKLQPRSQVVAIAGRACVALLLGALWNWYDTFRAMRYAHALLGGAFNGAALPNYSFLRLSTVPGWLLQTIGLYQLSNVSYDRLIVVIIVLLVPIGVLAIAAIGARTGRAQIAAALIVIASVAVGLYERLIRGCSYCEDRSLLVAAPLLIYLCATGFVSLSAARRVVARAITYGTGVTWVLVVVIMAGRNLSRFQTGSYFLDSTVRVLLNRLPHRGYVELEGFNMGPIPSMEQGFVYEAAEEKAWNRVSLVADHNQESSLVYLGGGTFTVRDAVFKPTYRYVLTRLPNVATNRRILAAGEGIALEVRGTHRPDVTVDFGLTVPASRQDQAGLATVNPSGQVRFVVTGLTKRDSGLTLAFLAPSGRYVVGTTGAPTRYVVADGKLQVCIPLHSSGGTLVVNVHVEPTQSLELSAMRVIQRACPT